METINVHKSNLNTFLERIEFLNKKLIKKNQPKVEWIVSDIPEHNVLQFTVFSSMETTNIKGVDVHFEGVVDLIEQDENSKVFKLENENLYKYLDECQCDECHKKIGRNKYIVFSKKGKEITGRNDLFVLGTTCAKLYFPFSVESHVGWLGERIVELVKDFDEYGGNGYFSKTVDMRTLYLGVAEATNNLKFYRKEGETKTDVCNLIFDKKWKPIVPEIPFEKVCEWIKGAYGDVKKCNGEFEYNIHSVFFDGDKLRERIYISCLGIACYAFVGVKKWYDKKVEKKIAEERRMKENEAIEFFGNVGDKFEKELVFDKSICYESQFGYGYILKFHDSENHVFTWFTNKDVYQFWCRPHGDEGCWSEFEAGKKYTLKGTVKAHDEYNGLKQTTVTRCKVVKDEYENHIFSKKEWMNRRIEEPKATTENDLDAFEVPCIA